MRRTTSLLAAAVLVLGVGAPSAEAYVVEWRNETDLEGNGQILAVDQADGDVLAMTSPFGESQVVRRLDGRSGAVEWTAEVSGQATRIAVDPTDGRVVVAGALPQPAATHRPRPRRAGAPGPDHRRPHALRGRPRGRSHVGSRLHTRLPGAEEQREALDDDVPRPHGAVHFAQEWEPPDGQSQPRASVHDLRWRGPQRSEDTRRLAERSEALDLCRGQFAKLESDCVSPPPDARHSAPGDVRQSRAVSAV